MNTSLPSSSPISGRTRLYGFIGDPVAYARTPQNLNPLFAQAEKDAVMIALHIHADRFEQTIPNLLALGNLDGVVITMPFKDRIIPFLDTISENARAVNAVNAAKRLPDGTWHGDIFDGAGLVGAARNIGLKIEGLNVGLIGSGGAGSAIAYALSDAGIASLTVYDLDTKRAEALAFNLNARGTQTKADAVSLNGLDLLINATPIGMNPHDDTPIDVTGLTAKTAVIDIVPKPDTQLSQRAKAVGCPFSDGAAMVAAQAAAIFSFFTV
jgi:shikimate dehydrogenase